MSTVDRVELVRTGTEAFEAGDIETAINLLHPEIELYAPPEIGNSGTFHGREGLAGLARQLARGLGVVSAGAGLD